MNAQTSCWARFSRFGDRWFAFNGKAKPGAVDVLQLVIDAPEFLGRGAHQSLPRAAMSPPQSHSNRVLVVIDEAGGVQLAVCPELGGDSAVVVGDVVATGHRYWHKKYDALAGPFQEFLGMPLTDWVAGRAGQDWSADEFRVGLERSMSEGRFPITIVVNELDSATKETLDYLREVNQQVRLLGYTCQVSGGDELVWPRELDEAEPAAESPASRSQPRPSVPTSSPKAPLRRQSARHESLPPDDSVPTGFGPLPASAARPEQQEILDRLIRLDSLGLIRRGLEYYVATNGSEATAAIVLAVDPDRWPFPKPDEVIVVVNTGPAHMAGFLNVAPKDVEEFLSSLPRVEQKEHKGTVLLRAANTREADQVVDELRALKEVTAGRPR